jgi:hypothetical protein
MFTYAVRLTVEGEHEEQDVLARNAPHAMRQALELWWHLEPTESAVLSARRMAERAAAAAAAPRELHELHEPRRSRR